MEEDSTPDNAAVDDGLDLSGEDSRDDTVDTSADSGDDASSSDAGDDDNAPSGADDKSGDDEKSTTDESDAKSAPALDKDIAEWAEKRGYGTDLNDRELKIAQDARNSQRSFSSRRSDAAEQAKKLADNVAEVAKDAAKDDDADPLAQRLSQVEARLMTSEQNRQLSDYVYGMSEAGTPVTMAESDAMGELLTQTAKEDGKAGADFLLKHISYWHQLAKNGLGTDRVDTDSVAEKVRQEERARLEKANKAAGPNRSAKQVVPAKAKDEIKDIWEDDNI